MNVPIGAQLLIVLLGFLTIFINAKSVGMGRGRSSTRNQSAFGHSSSASKTRRMKPYYTRKFSKPGTIEHTSSFRSFVFGATSGYLAFSAGKHIIQDSSKPILFGDRKYYWGENKYVPNEELPIQCVNRIDPQDPQFGKVFFENESKPQEIVYGCTAGHNCCGYDCCPESTFFTSIFSLLVLLLILSVLGIFVIECIRWCLHCTYFCKHGHHRDFEPLTMKRKHELIEKPYIEICENVPINSNEEIITTTPSSNCTSSDSSSIDVAEDFEEYQNLNQTRNNIENSHKKQRIAHNLAVNLSLNDIDIVEVGENLLTGVNERTIESNRSLQRTQKNFQSQNPTIGNIDLCRLVTNLMCHDAVDVRYAIAGTSFMWNSLKSNVQNMNSLKYSMNTNFSDMLEPEFDLDIRNVKYKTQFTINPKENFVGLDLCYVFTNITFRDNSRFLNKVKQFLKTYFSVACNPKCLIWRFNVRRSGTCHKKTILNLPSRILDVLIDFLLTLTGVGSHSVSPTNVCRGTPFYISLGQNEQERNEVFTKIVHCRDDLIVFFRNAIIDCLNEIREMPFCLSTGRLISPLRGRKMQRSIITWKQYEQYLKEEIENPTDINVKRRTQFEEKMYQAADCEIRVLR